GRTLLQPARASELIARMRAGRDRLATLVHGLPTVRVYYEHPNNYKTYGRRTFANDLLRLCGGINIAGDLDQPRPTVNAEFVVDADPEVILLGAFTGTLDEVLQRPGWSTLSAVRSGRVARIQPHDRLLWSTRYVERAERLLLPVLHPEALRVE